MNFEKLNTNSIDLKFGTDVANLIGNHCTKFYDFRRALVLGIDFSTLDRNLDLKNRTPILAMEWC
jgi:hypothetical protein